MRAIIVLICVVAAVAAALAQRQEPQQEFTVAMAGALPKAGAEAAPLSLTLRTDGVGLFPVVWAAGGGFASHRGYVVDGAYDGTALTAHVRIFVIEYHVLKPYAMPEVLRVRDFTLTATRRDAALAGTWTSTLAGQALKGDLAGTVAPLPQPAPGFEAPVPGEHPCLLIRKTDIPALRAKAATPWGRQALERLKTTDRSKSNTAVARGLLYVLTGERRYADEARALLQAEVDGRVFLNIGPVHDPSRRLIEMCLAYDLIYDAVDEPFRAQMRTLFAERVEPLYNFNEITRPNGADSSNWSALYRAGSGVTALALMAEPGVHFPDPVKPVLPRLSGPADLHVGDGVPVVTMEPGKMWYDWLVAGPFTLRRGQDGLAGLGGAAAVRPERGTAVAGTGANGPFAGTFAPAEKLVIPATAHQVQPWMVGKMSLTATYMRGLTKNVPFSTLYGYAAMEVATAGYYRVDLIDYQLDNPCIFVAGTRLRKGDYVYLEAGRYPVMAWLPVVCKVDTNSHDRHYVCFHLTFTNATEAEAQAWLARETGVYEARVDDLRIRRAYCARTGGADPAATYWFEAARRRVYAWTVTAFGDWGFNAEGEAYCQHSFRNVLPFAHAARSVTGLPWGPAPNLANLLPAYAARTVFGPDWADLHTNTNGGGPLGVDSWARGYALVPEAMRPAVLAAWDRMQTMVDAGKLNTGWLTVTALDPMSAAFYFINHPAQDDAGRLGQGLPRTFADNTKGSLVFRNGYRDGDDAVATITPNLPMPGARDSTYAGAFQITALGNTWAVRGAESPDGKDTNRLTGLGAGEAPTGEVIHYAPQPDESGTVSIRLDRAYAGAQVVRAFGADYTGVCGAPALFAVADRVVKAGAVPVWQMLTDDKIAVNVAGNQVTLTGAGATMRLLVAAPAGVKIEAAPVTLGFEGNYQEIHKNVTFARKAIRITGGQQFLVVMTVQKGDAPPATVAGDGGDATVTVGKRTVRFDGEKIVFGTAG